jgi:lanosterol synthase
MVDYNYVECTTSALSGLKQFTKIDPEYRRAEISYVPLDYGWLTDRETITKAIDWIHSVQRPDGSWYGSWYVPLLLLLAFSSALHT